MNPIKTVKNTAKHTVQGNRPEQKETSFSRFANANPYLISWEPAEQDQPIEKEEEIR